MNEYSYGFHYNWYYFLLTSIIADLWGEEKRKTEDRLGENGFQLFRRGQKKMPLNSLKSHTTTTVLSPGVLKPWWREWHRALHWCILLFIFLKTLFFLS